MATRLLLVLAFPFVVLVGVLLLSFVIVLVFLVAEIFGVESTLASETLTRAFFGIALLVSLYGSWRVSRRMW